MTRFSLFERLCWAPEALPATRGPALRVDMRSRGTGGRRRDSAAGFTLIEMMVVMVIIGLLMALVGPRFIRQEEKAKVKAARAQVEMLGTALDTMRLDVGRYPTTQEGLASMTQRPFGMDRWDGPYLKKGLPPDPWNHPYYYRSPGEGGRAYDLFSYGADGAPGGDGDNHDVTSWEGDTG